jgi:NAD(P)-dependent dehydrogenase (short-subunit alcohol dehydrogenase family)
LTEKARAEQAAAKMRADGHEAIALACDLSDPVSIEQAVVSVDARFGPDKVPVKCRWIAAHSGS